MTKEEGPGSSDGSGGNKNPHLLSSVVGLPSSSSKQHQQQKSASMLYHPSIFRYTCTGRLSLDSRNGGNRTASSGICHGIQSNLEHIDHWRLSTRDDAIKHFEYASAMGSSGGGDMAGGEKSSPSDQEGGGGGSATAHAQQAVYLSNVLLYPLDDDDNIENNDDDDDEKDNNNKKTKKKKKKETIVSRKNTDGSSTITPQQETWSCYGSTEIDLLVLRPQNEKEESIACVSSYCAPGMTVRDLAVSSSLSNNNSNNNNNNNVGDGTRERTTTIRLGILEIVYATTVEGDDNTTNNINTRIGSKDKDQVGDEDKETTTASGSGGIFGGLATTTAPDKVIHSGRNIVKHMKINGQLLYQSVQENYPTRTYEASQRITNEFSKTFDRTTKLMKKVYNYIADEEDDDDD